MNDNLLGGGIPNIGGPKIDPRDYKTIKCDKCGHIVFKSAIVLKEIPGTIVGNGTEPIVYPLQVLVCDKCGTILKEDIKSYKLENDISPEIITDAPLHTENKSNIILS